MGLPERIQIGPIGYTVTTDQAAYNAVVASQMTHFFAHIGLANATITLDGDQTADHTRWALLHEVLHGCWHVTDPEGDTFTEEQAIRVLTGVLLDTLQRNPALVAYLVGEA
jgi:hypothetical protein